jgi:hypothetical protein
MILVLTVLIVGVFVWWFTISSAGITSSTYALEVRNSIEQIEERFVVEHVQIDVDTVNIWVYNYGKIGVNITNVYIESYKPPPPTIGLPFELPIGGLVKITVGNLVEVPEFVQVESKRGTVVIGFP